MNEIYQKIADAFIEKLQKGTVPWQKPWAVAGIPNQNIITRKQYNGINAFSLGMNRDFTSPYWMTFKQAVNLGGTVKRGSKSSLIIFWKMMEMPDRHNPTELKTVPLLRYSNVFNAEQVKDLPEKLTHYELPHREHSPIISAASIVASSPSCPVVHSGSRACYSPVLDKIWMPKPELFKSDEAYYATLFHEMTHATGHESRLNRDLTGDKMSATYSKEELIAEMGSSFLANEAGIMNEDIFENSAAYLKGWISVIKEDPKILVQAGTQAQKAADLLLNRSHIQKMDIEPEANVISLKPNISVPDCSLPVKDTITRKGMKL